MRQAGRASHPDTEAARRPAEEGKRLPTAFVEYIAVIPAQYGALVKIQGGIAEAAVVNQNDFVMRPAFVSEDVFQRPEISEVDDFRVDFFPDLARRRVAAAFAEFDAPAYRSVEVWSLCES